MITIDKKIKSYKFQPMIHRICGYFSLILIPCMIVILIYNYGFCALLGVIGISIIVLLFCWLVNRFRIEIYDDKIINYGFKKSVFDISKISSLTVEKRGFIQLEYENKLYKFAGFISFLSRWPDEEKNKDLVIKINKIIKELKM